MSEDEYSELEIAVGSWPDERSYRISLKNGEPFRIESVFAGYLGRITHREVKTGGGVWNRVVKAAGLIPA